MKRSHYWFVFAACSLGWLIVCLSIAPAMSGRDTYIFRDAGWNLASTGSFESAVLPYMRDATPRLYSHYTPIMPLLFAGYTSIFPRNAYAGTVFNLLLGLLAAAVALYWALRQPASKLRTFAALAIAVLPVAFITHDRPEALGLVLVGTVIAAAAASQPRPAFVGLLIALVFLAHPFAAIAASLWAFALLLSHNWNQSERWPLTLRQIATAAAVSVAAIIPVALLFYALDHDSLARFALHSLGVGSGLGMALSVRSGNEFLTLIKLGAGLGQSTQQPFIYLLSLSSSLLLTLWAVRHRSSLDHADWLPIAAGLASTVAAVVLFPRQNYYVSLTAFLIPLGLLIAGRPGRRLVAPGLLLMMLAILIHLPRVGFDVVAGIEQLPSYRAALLQPPYLLARLPSPNSLIAVDLTSYDLFKPTLQHIVGLRNLQTEDQAVSLAAIANCYADFPGDDRAVRPLPEPVNASDFHLIQANTQHLWITLLGHKLTHAQSGYGCDLYLRNNPAPDGPSVP
jgi:hypothetical protein